MYFVVFCRRHTWDVFTRSLWKQPKTEDDESIFNSNVFAVPHLLYTDVSRTRNNDLKWKFIGYGYKDMRFVPSWVIPFKARRFHAVDIFIVFCYLVVLSLYML